MSWKSRGVRGSALEELIIFTNEYYLKHNLARIDKVPTPIKVIEQGKDGMILKAFYEKKSTVDFIGLIQGVTVVFDAKETNLSNLPFKNIHEHQIEYMKDITNHGGIAFIIAYFKKYNIYHLIPFEIIYKYYQESKKGGRKSIPLNDLNQDFIIPYKNGILNYIPVLNTLLKYRESDLL